MLTQVPPLVGQSAPPFSPRRKLICVPTGQLAVIQFLIQSCDPVVQRPIQLSDESGRAHEEHDEGEQ